MEKIKVSQYEGETHKNYSELGKESEKGWDSWGNSMVTLEDGKKEQMSFYTDERLTKRLFTEPLIPYLEGRNGKKTVVDFGGGDGLMIEQIRRQLQEAHITEINPVLLDIDEKKLEKAKSDFPSIETVPANMFELPFENNSIDSGVSRMALQYFPKPEQEGQEKTQLEILKEVYRVLKTKSPFVVIYPASFEDDRKATYNDSLWKLLTYHRTDKDDDLPFKNTRSFTSGKTIANYATKIGFNVKTVEQVDWIEFRYTIDAIENRFGAIPDQNKEWMEEAIKNPMNKKLLDIIEWNNKKAVRLPISRLVLEK